MGSHKKKKYESDSSSESDSSNDSSSSEDRTNRKSHKKQKHSSDDSEPTAKKKYLEDSNGTESNKLRHRTSRKDDGKDADYKVKRNDYDSKHRSNDSNSHRYKERRPREDETEKKKESRYRECEEREKYNKDKRDDREYKRGKHNHRDRHDNRNRDRNREFDSNRREHNDDKYRRRRSSSFDHANAKWGKAETEKVEKKEPQSKDKPNFALSGKLTEETNTYRGVVIKYSEPPEARKPRRRWRLYPFKGEKALQTLYIHRESGYLIGRERKIVDLPVDHPSCSKQHAALQYRLVPFTRENGTNGKRVRPYLIDLDSANGTYINNKKIEPKKYYELFERDVIKFGYSSREYVLLHENSKDETLDDDVKMEEDDEAEVKVKKEP